MTILAHTTEGVNRTKTVRFCPFVFTGKEKDYESGFHYYGARYYWSELLTGWLSVDPMMDKYPNISPYAYCAWNPVKLVDPDGKEIDDYFTNIGVRLEGNASGIKVCDYADEIISSFAHEKGHVDLYWELGGDVSKYKAISKDVREQIAVKAEMSNPSWRETREVYKKDARRYGEKYGLKFNEKGELIQ